MSRPTLLFIPSKSDLKLLRYGKTKHILIYHCISGRLAGNIYGASWTHPIPQGFSSLLLNPYIKGVTHFQKVGWWRTLMVESVTLF